MLLFRLKLVLISFVHLSSFCQYFKQTKQWPSRSIKLPDTQPLVFFLFVLPLFLEYCTVKQACRILGIVGRESQKLENKTEWTSQATLLCWVYLFHRGATQPFKVIWTRCFLPQSAFTLTFPELLKEEAVVPAPAPCCPDVHTSLAQSSDIALLRAGAHCTYFLLSHPFLKSIYTSLLYAHIWWGIKIH